MKISLAPYHEELEQLTPMRWTGQVTEVVGLLVESRGPNVAIGDFCEVQTAGGRRIRTQVIGFRDGKVLSMPLEEIDGLQLGDPLAARSEEARVEVGPGLLGRVLDGFGKPMDGGPAVEVKDTYSLHGTPTNPLDRQHITQPLVTGIRAIDGLLPCGKGQRIGIFGGSGVGKSTLLGSMSRHNSADVTVIAMIGERNREVRGFLENELGEAGRKRSVVVCATSERPAPLRVRACFVALAVAEYFRDQGANVLLVMDSVTRLAMAQREIGLAAGEPPSQKGYTPSVFNLLPKVLERAGNFARGSITGFFTVLVEGDDFNEPICDAVRGILDGHFILSRQLGAQGALSGDRYFALGQPPDERDRIAGAKGGGAEDPGRALGVSRCGGSDSVGGVRRGQQSAAGCEHPPARGTAGVPAAGSQGEFAPAGDVEPAGGIGGQDGDRACGVERAG